MGRTSALLAAGVLAVGMLTACGGQDEPGGTTPTTGSSTTSQGPTGTAGAPTGEGTADGTAEVATAETGLGEILVDGDGRTLYLFTKDSPGTSACTGPCLEAWPVLEGEPTAGDGVDAALLGTIERDDGTVQATYGDWPLYYFAQDTAPGDVNGQAVNDVWWVISPDGKAVMTATPTSSGTGY